MQVLIHRNFGKQFAKVSAQIKIKFSLRRDLFLQDPSYPLLNNHPLTGDRKGEWSFNVTADWRVIYEFVDFDTVVFLEIGTHSNLYKK